MGVGAAELTRVPAQADFHAVSSRAETTAAAPPIPRLCAAAGHLRTDRKALWRNEWAHPSPPVMARIRQNTVGCGQRPGGCRPPRELRRHARWMGLSPHIHTMWGFFMLFTHVMCALRFGEQNFFLNAGKP